MSRPYERDLDHLNEIMAMFADADSDIRDNGVRELSELIKQDPAAFWLEQSVEARDLTATRQIFWSLANDPNPEVMCRAADALPEMAMKAPVSHLAYWANEFVKFLDPEGMFPNSDRNVKFEIIPGSNNIVAPPGQEGDDDHIVPVQRFSTIIYSFEAFLKKVPCEIALSLVGPWLVHQIVAFYKRNDGKCPFDGQMIQSADMDVIKGTNAEFHEPHANLQTWLRLFVSAGLNKGEDNASVGERACPNTVFNGNAFEHVLHSGSLLRGAQNFPTFCQSLVELMSDDQYYLASDRLKILSRSALEVSIPYMDGKMIDLVVSTAKDRVAVTQALVTMAPMTVAACLPTSRMTEIHTLLSGELLSEDPNMFDKVLKAESLEAYYLFVSGLLNPLNEACAVKATTNEMVIKKLLSDGKKDVQGSDILSAPILNLEGRKMISFWEPKEVTEMAEALLQSLLKIIDIEVSSGAISNDEFDDVDFEGDFDVSLDEADDEATTHSPIHFGKLMNEASETRRGKVNQLIELVNFFYAIDEANKGHEESFVSNLIHVYGYFVHQRGFIDLGVKGLSNLLVNLKLKGYSGSFDLSCMDLSEESFDSSINDIYLLSYAMEHSDISVDNWYIKPQGWVWLNDNSTLMKPDILQQMMPAVVSASSLKSLTKEEFESHLAMISSVYNFDREFGSLLLKTLSESRPDMADMVQKSSLAFYFTASAAFGGIPYEPAMCQKGDKAVFISNLVGLARGDAHPNLSLSVDKFLPDKTLAAWVRWVLAADDSGPPAISWVPQTTSKEDREITNVCFEFIQQMGVAKKLTALGPENYHGMKQQRLETGDIIPSLFMPATVVQTDAKRSIIPFIMKSMSFADRQQFLLTISPEASVLANMVLKDDYSSLKTASDILSALNELDQCSDQGITVILWFNENKKHFMERYLQDVIPTEIKALEALYEQLAPLSTTLLSPMGTGNPYPEFFEEPAEQKQRRDEYIQQAQTVIRLISRLAGATHLLQSIASSEFSDEYLCFRFHEHYNPKDMEKYQEQFAALTGTLIELFIKLQADDCKLQEQNVYLMKLFVTDHGEGLKVTILTAVQRFFSVTKRFHVPAQLCEAFGKMLGVKKKQNGKVVSEPSGMERDGGRDLWTYSCFAPPVEVAMAKLFLRETSSAVMMKMLLNSNVFKKKKHEIYADAELSFLPITALPDSTSGRFFGGLLSLSNLMRDRTALEFFLVKQLSEKVILTGSSIEKAVKAQTGSDSPTNATAKASKIDLSQFVPQSLQVNIRKGDQPLDDLTSQAGFLTAYSILPPAVPAPQQAWRETSLLDEHFNLLVADGLRKMRPDTTNSFSNDHQTTAFSAQWMVIHRCMALLQHDSVSQLVEGGHDITGPGDVLCNSLMGIVAQLADMPSKQWCSFSLEHRTLMESVRAHLWTQQRLASLAVTQSTTTEEPKLPTKLSEEINNVLMRFICANYPSLVSFLVESWKTPEMLN